MRRCPFWVPAIFAILVSGPVTSAARADGFVETLIADSLNNPVSMAIAPDGRIFVCEQGGRLRVIDGSGLLPTPFVTVATVANDEEGLLGVALDPGFPGNPRVYVAYTAQTPTRHNRISRFRASGNVAAGAESVLYDLDDHVNHFHAGGGLHFGPDGTLYLSMGDNGNGGNAQNHLSSTAGKILRINPDGTIPTNNPFYGTNSGKYRAIWAYGFRNPFTFNIQPGTGRMFINDVGGFSYEEVNEGIAGANYGWPNYEGPGGAPTYRDPVHWYSHSNGCAITGAAFYNPAVVRFPASYVGKFFYTEYCGNVIRMIDPDHPSTYSVFGPTRTPGPVDIRVGPDGNLYYLARGNSSADGGDGSMTGEVVRVSYQGSLDVDPLLIRENVLLRPNTPNPFWARTTLSFSLSRPRRARLLVFDLRGSQVAELADDVFSAGVHTITWEPGDLPAGLYLASLTVDGWTQTRKMARLR
jgi:glucose/arabinose dehydrogenase